ncbi:MAG TPA: HlyD family efflux transporter periplasmic adaptor subunit [Caulobacteraceae bacterium]|nr:HlyD family efflux transporter periplasmic adaptor subunit [Caulobacteraceae bacterium]
MADDQAGHSASAVQPAAAPTRNNERRMQQRKRLFAILGGAGAVVVVLFALWWLLVGSRYVTTDDAYVGAEVAQVTPLVGGPVKAVHVHETDMVKSGDVLVELDPADATLAYQKAEADYEATVRQITGGTATADALSAQVSARTADLDRAQAQIQASTADLAKAKLDYDRRASLANSGAVSGEELTAAKTAYEGAKANLAAAQAASAQADAAKKAAQAQFEAQQALVQGDVSSNPQVAAMRAARDSAKLDLDRTVIRAPLDGVVSRKQVEVGQRVAVGSTLMSIVPITQAYVDANFKEVQLRKVRQGQPVTLKSDLYGGGVVYHGQVVGVSGGTGSAFSLIPAQNATGNWIKVVQRLPVRIRLDPAELAAHPLRVGLSMKATIDVSKSGSPDNGG